MASNQPIHGTLNAGSPNKAVDPAVDTANASVPSEESLQDTTRLYRGRKSSSSRNDQ